MIFVESPNLEVLQLIELFKIETYNNICPMHVQIKSIVMFFYASSAPVYRYASFYFLETDKVWEGSRLKCHIRGSNPGPRKN